LLHPFPISRYAFNDCAKHSLQKSSLLRANQTAGQLNQIENTSGVEAESATQTPQTAIKKLALCA
jgi:hypothetical protein